ncbi:MAG: Haloacid dehalogenase domain protein hydrolase [Gammaproteobacteria bacterium]|nr:Haloacid dehalogenase domain protein hydrolase [Gammaproteobacteria bacterium]
MPIRAVLFDLGNTLVSYYQPADFMPILRRSLDACLLTLGHSPLGREAQTALVHRALEMNQERADLAVWPLEERLRVLFSHYAPDTTLTERLCGAFLEPIFSTARVSRDALQVLTSLKRMDMKTAIVSNTPWGSSGHAWRSELARHGLLADAVVFCTDVGWRKPHAAPFRRALEMLDVAAKEAVFVGDDPVWDVEGANGAGVRPILLATRAHQSNPAQVTVAASLPEVLAKIEHWNSTANAGPQPALA